MGASVVEVEIQRDADAFHRGRGRVRDDLVQACLPIAEQLTTQFRSAGVFGENLSVSADADPQTKLLAMVGRRA